MRILIIPRVYKTQALDANSSVMALHELANGWVERDENIHLYIVAPNKDDVPWEDDFLLANHDRVTVIEATRQGDDKAFQDANGHTDEELKKIGKIVEEDLGYFDAVYDQRAEGRERIFTYLNHLLDHMMTKIRAFTYIHENHDTAAPFKSFGDKYPNGARVMMDYANMYYADDVWFESGYDRDVAQEHLPDVFQYDVVGDIMDKSLTYRHPMDFTKYKEDYRDEPKYIHIAGDLGYDKKNAGIVLQVAEKMFQRYGTEAIVTSMKSIPDKFEEKSFTECYPNCPRGQYKRMLQKGDIIITASKNEGSAATFLEQAASGQVFIAWDKPWLYDKIPDDYKLTAPSKKALSKVTAWAINNWDEAVSENKRLVEYLRNQRAIDSVAERTHDRLKEQAAERTRLYSPAWDEEVVYQATQYIGDDEFSIKELNDATEKFTERGDPILDLFSYSLVNLVMTLRNLGYKDVGNAGTPRFKKVDSSRPEDTV